MAGNWLWPNSKARPKNCSKLNWLRSSNKIPLAETIQQGPSESSQVFAVAWDEPPNFRIGPEVPRLGFPSSFCGEHSRAFAFGNQYPSHRARRYFRSNGYGGHGSRCPFA